MNSDPRAAELRTTAGPQIRQAVKGTSQARKFAAIIVAFMDSHDTIDFDLMLDMTGLTHAELASIVQDAQMLVEARR